MALNFRGIWNSLFDQSQRDNLGIGGKGSEGIWSCSGSQFQADQVDVRHFDYGAQDGRATAAVANVVGVCPVFLQDGVIITEVIVFGNAGSTDETWWLNRVDTAGSEVTIATANFNTSDKSIASVPAQAVEVVDNTRYTYFIGTTNMSSGDRIYGARIKFTH